MIGMRTWVHVCAMAAVLSFARSLPAEIRLDLNGMTQVMRKVLTDSNDRSVARHLQGPPKNVTGMELASDQGGGTWSMQVLGWGKPGGWSGDQVPLQRLPLVIQNHGDRAELDFLGPSIPGSALDALENEGKLGKAKKSIISDRDDVKITFGRKHGRLSFNAVYPYKGDEDDVVERLSELISDARELIIVTLGDMDWAVKKGKTALWSKPFKGWNIEDTALALDNDLHTMELKKTDAGMQFYYWTQGGLGYEIYFEDELQLSVSKDLGSEVSPAQLAKVKAWTDANPFDGGQAVTRIYPGYPTYLQVFVRFKQDGSMTGAELKKRYHNFFYQYCKKAYKQL